MGLFVNEWQKLLRDRFTLLILVCICVLTAVFSFVSAEDSRKRNTAEYERIFALYENDNAVFTAEKSELTNQLMSSGWESDAASALKPYIAAAERGSYASSMKSALDYEISVSDKLIREYDAMRMTKDSYLYVREVDSREIYGSLYGSIPEYEYLHGWDDYFGFDFINVILLLLIILLVPRISSRERDCNMTQQLFCAKKGRGNVRAAKCMCGLSFTFLLALSVSALPLLTVLLTTGFSSWGSSIHSIGALMLAPFDCTIWQFLLLTFGIRLICALAVCGFTMLISAFIRSYPIVVAASALPLALDLALGSRYGLLFTMSPCSLFERCMTLNFFSSCAFLPVFSVSLYLLIALLLSFLSVLISRRRRGESKALSLRLVRAPHYPSTLFGCELRKLAIKKHSLAVLALALLIVLALGFLAPEVKTTSAERFYKRYMEQLSGELTEVKLEFINSELEKQKQYCDMDYEYIESFEGEERSRLEAAKALATPKLTAIERVSERADYVSATEGAYLIYDTGWNRAFASDFDVWFFVSLCVILCGVIAGEYDLRFAPVMRASKRGRADAFAAKTKAALLVSAVSGAVFETLFILFAFSGGSRPNADYPIQSISRFSSASGMSIGSYLLLTEVMIFVCAICFSLFMLGISALTKKSVPALIIGLLFLLLPYMSAKLGLEAIEPPSFSQLASFGGYLSCCGSFSSYALGSASILLFCLAIYAAGAFAYCFAAKTKAEKI